MENLIVGVIALFCLLTCSWPCFDQRNSNDILMRSIDWLQLVLFVAALALITKPMGLYLVQVLDAKGRTWLDPVLKPLERVTYRLMGTQPDQEQDWKHYALAMLLFSLVGCLFTYVI